MGYSTNERSQKMMIEILAEMLGGLGERPITDDAGHRIYMRVVRDVEGKVFDNHQRYEPPRPDA
jgi:hypothetical protein